jgi:hypothetical protein
MKFTVTYKNGITEVISLSDCDTVEGACNRIFGCSEADASEHGSSVTIADEAEAPAAEAEAPAAEAEAPAAEAEASAAEAEASAAEAKPTRGKKH